MKKLFLLLALLSTSVPAWAANRYVDSMISPASCGTYSIASRNCSGSDGNAYKTIQSASDASAAGDTIHIRSGTYAGFSVTNSGSAGNIITYRPYLSESVTISAASGTVNDGGGHDVTTLINGKSYITFNGVSCSSVSVCQLTISGSAGYNQIEYKAGAHHLTIQYIAITGATGSGLAGYDESHDVTIESNRIYSNAQSNIPLGTDGNWASGTICFHGCYNITYRSNLVYANAGEGLTCGDHGHEWTIEDNLISDNWSVNLYSDGCQNVTMRNNIVWNSADGRARTIVNGYNPDIYTWPVLIVLAVGDSNTAYTSAELHLTGYRIYNNILYNGVYGFQRYNSILIGSPTPDSDWVVANNTLIATGGGFEIKSADSYSDFTFKNNLICCALDTTYGQRFVYIDDACSGCSWGHSAYRSTSVQKYTYNGTDYTTYATWASASGDTNSLQTDPSLVSSGQALGPLWGGSAVTEATVRTQAASFSINPGSPAVDHALTLADFSTDRDGITRPQGPAWDIGAYEFPSSGGGGGGITCLIYTPCDNFDLYSTSADLAALNGGGGWTGTWTEIGGGSRDATIETAPAGMSGKALKIQEHASLEANYARTFTASAASSVRFDMMLTITNPNGKPGVILLEGSGISDSRMYLVFDSDANIKIFDNGSGMYQTVRPYSANTKYTCTIEWNDSGQPNNYRADCGTGFSSWYAVNGGSYSTISGLRINDDATNAHTFWLDTIGTQTALPVNVFTSTTLKSTIFDSTVIR